MLVSRMPKSGSEQGRFDQNGRLDHLDHFVPVHSTAATPYIIYPRIF